MNIDELRSNILAHDNRKKPDDKRHHHLKSLESVRVYIDFLPIKKKISLKNHRYVTVIIKTITVKIIITFIAKTIKIIKLS